MLTISIFVSSLQVYEPIESVDSLAARLSVFQQQYNEAVRGGAMDLVFFKVKQITQSINPLKIQ